MALQVHETNSIVKPEIPARDDRLIRNVLDRWDNQFQN
jgi:hypothetical protein